MIRLLNAKHLLNSGSHKQNPDEEEPGHQQTTPYVIISHVWMKKEVVYEDMVPFNRLEASKYREKPDSAAKIVGACNAVLGYKKRKVENLWLDTVCIDKKDPSELSMSINSMYRWYKDAEVCFAYLDDYPTKEVPIFTQSKWFTRGWTLQELVAPRKVIFFDKDWKEIGDKNSLQTPLTNRTKISGRYLLHPYDVSYASISQRMSWFSGRMTSVSEDTAYCLLGLFGVNMPLLYGEGKERAFRRLQEEIMKYSDDHSLFAWKSEDAQEHGSGLLAGSPDCFQGTGGYVHKPNRYNNKPFEMTNKGISIDLYLQRYQNLYTASIDCLYGDNHYLGMYFECLSSETQQYRRTKTNELCIVPSSGRGELRSIYVKPPNDI